MSGFQKGENNPSWKGGVSLKEGYKKERATIYRKTHLEKMRRYQKKYREEHKEELIKKAVEYRKTRRKHIAKYNKKWIKNNPEKYRQQIRNKKARKRGADGSHTLREWESLKKKYNYMCLCCKRFEPEIKLTEDHIVPLKYGGSNYISNIQPLCANCNSRKHTKTINFLGSMAK